ncbi:restriction endonuclease subunit S [Shewanella sp. SM69]|uniref:restriction endonuclease subunit S n=1 Tax=Shewanella sp. SM69 TaxID=2912802 RepID=UPI0021DB2360|nr:restriction endonuclease subunit S [Shewanella sp. SM69]MCU8037341.1 restriction endonuclease subunit S [Shewanella sp. SM69]
MAGRYKAYQEYKDSGVEWLKEIPIHWDCKKLKFFLNDLVRGPFGSALKKEFFTTDGIKVYEQKNCIQDSVALGDSYISEDTYRDLSRFTVTNGDLLMSCSGTIGRIVEVTEPYEKGIINQALLIMRINECAVNKAFFKHIFRSEDVQKQIKDNTQGGAMQNLVATDVFKSVSFTVPPYEEQQKIASFLDHETAKIDTLIAKQEKLIELLKEKRQAVISHAVTKGISYKGQPNAPMKDSGVEWLGEVPEHWDIFRSKRLFPESKNRAPISDMQLSATQDYGVISQKRFMQLAGRKVVQ